MQNNRYCCCSCGSKLPIKSLFFLNGFTRIKCFHCGIENQPDKVNKWAFVIGFLPTVVLAKTLLIIGLSIGVALFLSAIQAVFLYAGVLLYTYSTVKFKRV